MSECLGVRNMYHVWLFGAKLIFIIVFLGAKIANFYIHFPMRLMYSLLQKKKLDKAVHVMMIITTPLSARQCFVKLT